jgi:hypothetical protein
MLQFLEDPESLQWADKIMILVLKKPRPGNKSSFFIRSCETKEMRASRLNRVLRRPRPRVGGSKNPTTRLTMNNAHLRFMSLMISTCCGNLWRMSMQTQESHLKGKEKSQTHILQRLKESALTLTADQMFATVRYHVKRQEVIVMQREAADLLRRSVDSEYHEHYDVPHNRGNANDVLGSINLKALMDKYYDIRPGASRKV